MRSTKNKIVIICPITQFAEAWGEALQEEDSSLEIEYYPDDTARERTEYVLAFLPPEGVFTQFPNLKVVNSMGAGVRLILDNPGFPDRVEVTRIIQPSHQRDMADFVLAVTLSHLRRLDVYRQYQSEKKWKPRSYRRPEETTVGIMGIGHIGQVIGKLMVKNGFKVVGWSRSAKHIGGIQTFVGEQEKKAFLKRTEILVCVLPLTPDTEGILNKEVFALLPPDAYLINVGRGAELNEKDLLSAIAEGRLSGAALDVFKEEPLPEDHPFWENDKIQITPHTAGVTHPGPAAKEIVENYYRMKKGKPLKNKVDKKKGY